MFYEWVCAKEKMAGYLSAVRTEPILLRHTPYYGILAVHVALSIAAITQQHLVVEEIKGSLHTSHVNIRCP